MRGQECTIAITRHSTVHMCENEASTACAWAALHNKLKKVEKEHKQEFLTGIPRNLRDVG